MELKNSKATTTKKEWLVSAVASAVTCAFEIHMMKARLKEAGFKDEADLDDTIKQVDAAIQRARNKELGIDENEEKVTVKKNKGICDK